MSANSKTDWMKLKITSATRWRLYSINPFLPEEVRTKEAAKWLAYEEAADNALDLMKQGHEPEDVWQMMMDFLEWKLGSAQ